MMALEVVGKPITWNKVNSMTDYTDNLYSWTPQAVVSISKLIPSVKLISNLDYREFAKNAEKYFKEINKNMPEWFELQKAHASPTFSKEQNAAQELIKLGLYSQKILTLKEFEDLLKNNILIAVVDAGQLASESWHAGHFVLVYSSNGKFTIHDPGLPPKKAWRVDKKEFMKAYKNELIVIPKV